MKKVNTKKSKKQISKEPKAESITTKRRIIKYKASVAQTIGERNEQEDYYTFQLDIGKDYTLFAVYDGHRGDACVKFVHSFFPTEVIRLHEKDSDIATVLKQAVANTHEAWAKKVFGDPTKRHTKNTRQQEKLFATLEKTFFENGYHSGTTLCAIVTNKYSRVVHVCNIGDSRCAVLQGDYIIESKDHGIPKVLDWLKGTGFEHSIKVKDGRIMGDINIGRTIGDFTPIITGVLLEEPTLTCFTMEPNAILVLATDGLYDTEPDTTTTQDIFINPIQNADDVLKHVEGQVVDNTTVIVLSFD